MQKQNDAIQHRFSIPKEPCEQCGSQCMGVKYKNIPVLFIDEMRIYCKNCGFSYEIEPDDKKEPSLILKIILLSAVLATLYLCLNLFKFGIYLNI